MQSSLLWRNEPRLSRCYICLLQLLYGLTELGRERLSEEFRSLGKAGIAGEEFDMVHHAFIMFLYGMMAYALMSAIVVGFWGIRSLRFRQPEVTASNLEAAILGWLSPSYAHETRLRSGLEFWKRRLRCRTAALFTSSR